MKNATCYTSKLPVFRVLMKPHKLILGNCGTFGQDNHEITWRSDAGAAASTVDKPVNVLLHDANRKCVLYNAACLYVHDFRLYILPRPILLHVVDADFSGWGCSGFR